LSKLHSQELNDLYSSPNIIRVIKSKRMKWAGHVARIGGEERCIQGFGGETWGKGPLGRSRRIWEDNIKINLQEVDVGALTGLIWLRVGTGGGHLWTR